MFRKFLLPAAALALMAVTAFGIQTQVTAQVPPNALDLMPEQVSFNHAGLSKFVHGTIVPAMFQDPDTVLTGSEPAHLRYTFDNDKTPDYFNPRQRQLLVFPIAAYREITGNVVNGVNVIGQSIDQLSELLAKRPAEIHGDIPVLPLLPSNQTLTAAVKYLGFPGGIGMRFIAHYAQDVSPISNATIFYTFQGITSDGKYYVSFFYPVATPALPTGPVSMTAKEMETFSTNFETYLQETRQELSAAQYEPQLAKLDALVQSLKFNPPRPTRQAQAPIGRMISFGTNTGHNSVVIQPNQCVTLGWRVEGNLVSQTPLILKVLGQSIPEPYTGSYQFCPNETSVATLIVNWADGSRDTRQVLVQVAQPTSAPAAPTTTPAPASRYNFWADSTTINNGQCTNLHWATNNVKDVYLNEGNGDEGVVGNDSRSVCPTSTTTYVLKVLLNNGQQVQQSITINVNTVAPTATPIPTRAVIGTMIIFGTDKGESDVTIGANECVNLTWRAAGNFARTNPFVLNVGGQSTPVAYTGTQQVCPKQSEVATFTVTFADGSTTSRTVNITVQ